MTAATPRGRGRPPIDPSDAERKWDGMSTLLACIQGWYATSKETAPVAEAKAPLKAHSIPAALTHCDRLERPCHDSNKR